MAPAVRVPDKSADQNYREVECHAVVNGDNLIINVDRTNFTPLPFHEAFTVHFLTEAHRLKPVFNTSACRRKLDDIYTDSIAILSYIRRLACLPFYELRFLSIDIPYIYKEF